MIEFSASGRESKVICPGYKDSSSSASERGHDFHTVMDAFFSGQETFSKLTEEQQNAAHDCYGIMVQSLGNFQVWDTECRKFGNYRSVLDHKLNQLCLGVQLRPGVVMSGMYDLLGIVENYKNLGSVPAIWDYKTGNATHYTATQLKTYWTLLYFASEDWKKMIDDYGMALGILVFPDRGYCQIFEFSPQDLVNELEIMKTEILNQMQPVLRNGSHCKYCRRKHVCPAVIFDNVEMEELDAPLWQQYQVLIRMQNQVKALEERMDILKENITLQLRFDCAAHSPDGTRHIKLASKGKRDVDVHKVEEFLKEHGVDPAVIYTTPEPKLITKKELKDLMRKHGVKPKEFTENYERTVSTSWRIIEERNQ